MSVDLRRFHDLKTRGKIPEEKRDISHVENREDLYDIIEIGENKIVLNGFPDFRHLIQNADAVLVHASNKANIYALVSYESSRQIGAGTRWCTVPNAETFFSYSKKSFLYVLFVKQKKGGCIDKYQIHFATRQFTDVDDRMLKREIDVILSKDMKMDMIQFAVEENDPFALLYFNEFDKISLNHFRKLSKSSILNQYGCGKMNQGYKNLITSNHGLSLIASLLPSEIDEIFFKNPTLIENVSHPTKQMKIAAIRGDSQYILKFKELLSEESVIEDIVRKNHKVFLHIPKPSRKLQILAVDLGCFDYIKNPLPEIRISAVKKVGKI